MNLKKLGGVAFEFVHTRWRVHQDVAKFGLCEVNV